MFSIVRVFVIAFVIFMTSPRVWADAGFYLAPSPQRNDCYNAACQALDAVEASGYEMARRGKISWIEMVDRFYRERSRIFPHIRDDQITSEIRSYQRVLAEKKDAGKITEAEWVFLLTRQLSEIDAREAKIRNNRGSPQYYCNETGSGYFCNPIN